MPMDMLTPTCLLVQREGELYQIARLCAQTPLGIKEAVVHVHLDGGRAGRLYRSARTG